MDADHSDYNPDALITPTEDYPTILHRLYGEIKTCELVDIAGENATCELYVNIRVLYRGLGPSMVTLSKNVLSGTCVHVANLSTGAERTYFSDMHPYKYAVWQHMVRQTIRHYVPAAKFEHVVLHRDFVEVEAAEMRAGRFCGGA